MNRNVAVLDLGTVDLSLIIAALEAAGSKAIATNQRSEILDADGFVIYGASKLSAFMSVLDKSKAAELVDTRLAGGKAVLGIGAGLHAMFETSAEDNEIAQGLAQWPGMIQRLESQSIAKAKVQVAKDSMLFQGLENDEFFFDQIEAVLEFSLQVDPPFVAPMVSYLNQEQSFIAAVENGPLTGISFYPERSGDSGIALLRNWLGTL
jgi:imidazole glycerol-phosphate synthase subunit HisH